MIKEDLLLMTGSVHPGLTERVRQRLEEVDGRARVAYHVDGDDDVQALVDPYGRDISIVQPVAKPAALGYFQLFVLIDALKRAGARRISVHVPHYACGRQDRQSNPFEPITAALVADLLVRAGADRIVWIDPHAKALAGMVPKPCTVVTLTALQLVDVYLESLKLDGTPLSFCGTDFNATKDFAKPFLPFFTNSTLISAAKGRLGDCETEIMFLLGVVDGRLVVICDDMVSTFTTGGGALKLLFEKKAEQVWLVFIHPVCVQDAWKKLADPRITKIITTNTLPTRWKGGAELVADKLTMIDVAPLIAATMLADYGGAKPQELNTVEHWRKKVRLGLNLTVDPRENESPFLDMWEAVEPILPRISINADEKIIGGL